MSQRNQAIVLVILSALFFALMNLLVRLAGDIPFIQKAFFRNLIALVLCVPFVYRSRHNLDRFRVNREQTKYLVLRAVMGTVSLLCNFYAIDHMALADATVLNKLSPFFAILVSAVMLKERFTRGDFLVVLVAFLGTVLVIKPKFDSTLFPAIIGLMGGFTAGYSYSVIRKLGQLHVESPVIMLWFSAISCISILPGFALFYVPMASEQLRFLLLAGLMAALAQFCVTGAFSMVAASEVAVFNNCQILFSALLGVVFLQQRPDALSYIGYVVIIGAAGYKFLHDKKKVT